MHFNILLLQCIMHKNLRVFRVLQYVLFFVSFKFNSDCPPGNQWNITNIQTKFWEIKIKQHSYWNALRKLSNSNLILQQYLTFLSAKYRYFVCLTLSVMDTLCLTDSNIRKLMFFQHYIYIGKHGEILYFTLIFLIFCCSK